VQELDGVLIALDAAVATQLQLAASTEDIFLRDVDVVGGNSAVIGEVAVDIRRPRVLCHHGHVDDAIVRRRRGHRCAGEKVEEAQIALRLLEPDRIVGIAFAKKQKAPDECRASLDVKSVDDAVEAAIGHFRGVVDRPGVNSDASDAKRRACEEDTARQKRNDESDTHRFHRMLVPDRR